MKRQVIGLLVIALLLAGSVSAKSTKLGEGCRSFFYYLYEDFTLENAEGKKLTYKDTEFSGDMDYMVSGNTSTEGSVVIPDSEYYIFKTDSSEAKLNMGEPFGKPDEWYCFVEGKNIKSICMSGRGVEVLGDDMSYEITTWDGTSFVSVCGEQESRVHLAAAMQKTGATGMGVHSEKAPAQIILNPWSSFDIVTAEGTNEPGHWTHLANTEGKYKLNQYEGDGRFPDVVTGKREWPLYGKILVVVLPVAAAAAIVMVYERKKKTRAA